MIFISAGHHPAAPGASFERFIEHDEAVIWAEKLNIVLDDISTLVPAETLQKKVDFINSRIMNGDIALEIHFNAARDKDNNPIGRGCETLYYPGSENGKHIATLCQQALSVCYPPDRGVKEGWYKMDPERGADFFLARTKCPAIIIEPEFVHHSGIILDNREEAINNLANVLREYDNSE